MAHWPKFEVWEGDEPVDAAFDYARRFGLGQRDRFALLQAACDDGFVECDRGDPVAFRFAVTEGDEKKGEIEMVAWQSPADAVYDYCKKEKYLQPKYTRLHVRASLHASFCAALDADRGLTAPQRVACDRGPRAAREPRFRQEFTVAGLTYKMPFYDDDFPPCDGRPGPDGLDADARWTPGADWADPDCVPRELRAAQTFCERLEPYPYGCAESPLGAPRPRSSRRADADFWRRSSTGTSRRASGRTSRAPSGAGSR